ncbi:MAG: hypothetical protein ACOX69_02325 [Coriobacteriales bacterium]|jgi:glycine cleavage system aminomethyltransferase T
MSEDKSYEPVLMKHIPVVPFDPQVFSYASWGESIPMTYTNWREETLSWKETCYIHANLSCFPVLTITGPDAVKFVSDISVNGYGNFEVGRCKHMIMCTPSGHVFDHGLVLRTAQDQVQTYVTPFYVMFRAEQGDYDIDVKMTGDDEDHNFVFQLAGPRSLEIVENALHEDIHDLKFMRFRWGKIAGHDVRILRMGMGGSLSYEVHGFGCREGIDVYNELLRVGKPYGIRKMGVNQYECNHTENGFPQATIHFPAAATEIPGYLDYLAKFDFYVDDGGVERAGSMADQPLENYYRNPYELGWGHMVKFDHEFTGREALEKIAQNHREMVTLVWNHEDIMKVFASFFEKGEEPYADMPFPVDISIMGAAGNRYFQDKVLKDGKQVGVSMWRTYTLYYRETISLCCIDPDLAQEGTQVEIVWGDAGSRQLNIRATVARFPYLDLTPNRDFDMESIPHYAG